MSNYKKRTPLECFRHECSKTDKRCVIFIPLLLLLLGIFTRWVSGSPIPTLHYIEVRDMIPPIWLFVLLFSLSYVTCGLSLGLLLGNRVTPRGEKKYQGAMWMCIAIFLGYAWYPIFFCARLFLVSALCSLICLFCAICASVCVACVSKMAFWLSALYDAWLVYLALLNMQIFFAI